MCLRSADLRLTHTWGTPPIGLVRASHVVPSDRVAADPVRRVAASAR